MKTFCLLCTIVLVMVGGVWLLVAWSSLLAAENDVSIAAFVSALATVFFGLAFFVLGEIYGKIAEIAANTRKQ